MEIKPEQVKPSFGDGILQVRLSELMVVNAQRVTVESRAGRRRNGFFLS